MVPVYFGHGVSITYFILSSVNVFMMVYCNLTAGKWEIVVIHINNLCHMVIFLFLYILI